MAAGTPYVLSFWWTAESANIDRCRMDISLGSFASSPVIMGRIATRWEYEQIVLPLTSTVPADLLIVKVSCEGFYSMQFLFDDFSIKAA